MQESQDLKAIEEIRKTLEQMIIGKQCDIIGSMPANQGLKEIVELINILNENMDEMNSFARNLAKGNLEIPAPSRRNYIAATLKELHSQLSSFIWIVRQLTMGKVVDRLDYMGELSDALNGLIDIIANYYKSTDSAGEARHMEFEAPVSSWQYHQVFLALDHISLMILEIDEEGRIIFSNRAAKAFLGEAELLSDRFGDEKLSSFALELSVLSTESNTFPSFNEFFDKGSKSWFKVNSNQIQFPNRQKVYLHTIEDISADKKAVSELEKNAVTDYLTNVYNRSVGVNALEKIIEQEEMAGCAAFIDVDGLKQINDTYGHLEGDAAIKAISDTLLSCVRETDVVSRFGGDEFLIVFENCTIERANAIVDRMYKRLDEINKNSGKPYKLSFSHGIVQIDSNGFSSVKELILLMDKRMYERKKYKNILNDFDN